MKPILEIRNLTIALPSGSDRKNAVSDITLTVGRGEIVCLIGESGSGKSVISHTVMGLQPKELIPTCGEVLLDGENILQASAERLRALRCVRMSMIFQEPMTALNPVMRCGAQLEEVLLTHTKLGPKERLAKVRAIVEEVHLPDAERILSSFPHQLSGGQRQRIMIAMALIMEPVLLIADEPTTALDVTTQAQILKLIKALQLTRQTGVLFITHDFGVVAEIADRVAVLRLGHMVEVGPKAELLTRPQEAYTRMLIASVPSMTPKKAEPSKTAPVVLRVKDLCKSYQPQGFGARRSASLAVDHASLEIRRGQTLGIVGESGSGKSTLARCVARLIEPTTGSIDINGTDVTRLSVAGIRPLRRRIQIIFQDPYRSLDPRWTVGQAIMEGPLNFGLPQERAKERARKLLETVQLDKSAFNRFPHQFSGGQRQRICIARALAMEPELLIADEAVSALDVSVQAQVLDLLDSIRTRMDLAMLFITHDLRVAAQICDDVAVMSRGKVVEYGSAASVFSAPQHPYTQSLFAAAPGRSFNARSAEARQHLA